MTARRIKAVPTMWDPELLDKEHLPEPLDELHLDWPTELGYFVAANKHKIDKNDLGDGRFEYEVYTQDGYHLVSIESSRDLMLSTRKKRRRRR